MYSRSANRTVRENPVPIGEQGADDSARIRHERAAEPGADRTLAIRRDPLRRNSARDVSHARSELCISVMPDKSANKSKNISKNKLKKKRIQRKSGLKKHREEGGKEPNVCEAVQQRGWCHPDLAKKNERYCYYILKVRDTYARWL